MNESAAPGAIPTSRPTMETFSSSCLRVTTSWRHSVQAATRTSMFSWGGRSSMASPWSAKSLWSWMAQWWNFPTVPSAWTDRSECQNPDRNRLGVLKWILQLYCSNPTTPQPHRVTLPYSHSGVLIETNPTYIKVIAKLGLVAMWNRKDAFLVSVD